MRINLRIEFTNESFKEVSANAADLVAFEREFDKSISSLSGDVKISHLLWLAWHSEFRRKETKAEFDAWLEDVESVGASDVDPK
jgi:hypothetical protein